MEGKTTDFFINGPEGAVIVALDNQQDGLLFGAAELRDGGEAWLDYEFGSDPDGDMVSLYREAADVPVVEYHARGRRVDIVTSPDRLLIVWNHGRRALAVDGEPLSPGEMTASVPQGATPWLLRFADWLPGLE